MSNNESLEAPVDLPAKIAAAPEPPEFLNSSSDVHSSITSDDHPLGGSSFAIEPMRLEYVSNSNPEPHMEHQEGPILLQWTQCTSFIHNSISRGVVTLSRIAAENPKRVFGLSVILALALPAIGWFTNFRVEVEQEAILAPFSSLSRQHHDWIEKDSDFPQSTRPFDLLIHRDGDDGDQDAMDEEGTLKPGQLPAERTDYVEKWQDMLQNWETSLRPLELDLEIIAHLTAVAPEDSVRMEDDDGDVAMQSAVWDATLQQQFQTLPEHLWKCFQELHGHECTSLPHPMAVHISAQ